jgi:hypothetical protein
MKPAGMTAFNARKENRSGIYSYEQRSDKLAAPYEERLRRDKAAWNFFCAQPPSYRKAIGWWVVSAKQEATRLKRLEKLIKESARGNDCYKRADIYWLSAFLNGEADVTPAAPFVMRCALRVAAAGLFIMGVRLGHKFRKRRVHLHVVRHE